MVLDIACGEGYSSHLLSRTAKMVVGVGVSQEVIKHSRKKYEAKVAERQSFVLSACHSVLIPEYGVFDVVVSFETIEHMREAEQEAFLMEIKRLIKPGGLLIISTPDKLNLDRGSKELKNLVDPDKSVR